MHFSRIDHETLVLMIIVATCKHDVSLSVCYCVDTKLQTSTIKCIFVHSLGGHHGTRDARTSRQTVSENTFG